MLKPLVVKLRACIFVLSIYDKRMQPVLHKGYENGTEIHNERD